MMEFESKNIRGENLLTLDTNQLKVSFNIGFLSITIRELHYNNLFLGERGHKKDSTSNAIPMYVLFSNLIY